MTTVDARINPAAAQAALDSALTSEPSAASPLPQIPDPPEGTVELPAGWYDEQGALHHDAEVRELTGADEEMMAKVKGGSARMLQTVLARGVVQIGGTKATPAMLDNLLVGDTDALLLGIRIATFGPDVELEVLCPHCQSRQQRSLDLRAVPVQRLDGFRDFTVPLKAGTAQVMLPTHRVHKKLVAASDKSGAELNSLLLAETVLNIGGSPVTADRILRLGLRDRQTLLTAIAGKLVGPRLEEVSLPCQSCSESIPLPLDMADLFRL